MAGMNIVKRNYLLLSLLLTALLAGVGGSVFFHLFPGYYFACYPLIPVFFFVVGLLGLNVTEGCRKRAPQRLAQVYLLTRMAKLVLTILVMIAYGVAAKDDLRAFLLTFIVNYVVYLIYDSWFFFHVEAGLKMKKGKSNETFA